MEKPDKHCLRPDEQSPQHQEHRVNSMYTSYEVTKMALYVYEPLPHITAI